MNLCPDNVLGPILCDLEQGRVVDLLPDREAGTLAAWLREHPGVEIVARDQAGAYADGVRRGAPSALQVADRWHLLRNCSEALLRVLDRHRVAFAHAAKAIATDSVNAAPPTPKRPTKAERREQQRQADRDARFRAVATLARAGLGVRAIVRETGLARNTVRRWMRGGAAPTWRKGERGRITDPFLPYLRQRLSMGMANATQLWREIKDQGYRGRVRTVRAAVAMLKRRPARSKRSPERLWRRPTPHRAIRALLSDVAAVERDQRFYDALLDANLEIRRVVNKARAFVALVRARNRAALAP